MGSHDPRAATTEWVTSRGRGAMDDNQRVIHPERPPQMSLPPAVVGALLLLVVVMAVIFVAAAQLVQTP